MTLIPAPSTMDAKTVKLIEYSNLIEGWSCRYVVMKKVFRFIGAKGKHFDSPRNGEDFPDQKTMHAFSFPNTGTVFDDDATHARTETYIPWEAFKRQYSKPQ